MSSYFHSASQSCPILSANCRYNLRLFRSFRGDSLGMDKSSSAKCPLYSDVVKGKPSPTGRGRRSRDDQSRSWRYSFHKYFTTFFLFISFFQLLCFITFFYTFFTHDIYPHPHSRPTTSTHTHDPRHLATLMSCTCNSRFPKQNTNQSRSRLSLPCEQSPSTLLDKSRRGRNPCRHP